MGVMVIVSSFTFDRHLYSVVTTIQNSMLTAHLYQKLSYNSDLFCNHMWQTARWGDFIHKYSRR